MNSVNNKTLLRKMSLTVQALQSAHDELTRYGRISQNTSAEIEIRAEKLADYCRFIRRRSFENSIINQMSTKLLTAEPKQAGSR